MIQFVVGAAAGYVFGTKAGRKRYSQIKNAYQAAVNSPASKAAVNATRKAIANKLDPQPRMREVKNLRSDSQSVLEPDED
ncbi:hypothetical protein CCICO_03215 [Corynebacterium ciconiae DSM 44920]|uniref:hypothetical protein n=1 Tax=Corynebacterium TaxID=1716 RepID=UPI00037F9663|nr:MULTISPECIES: hypothetical protein [Corynebacterium]WKD60686.1 hypothetical protein CCICO_03215 [Corynebacterium ciconiae DSM 44920]